MIAYATGAGEIKIIRSDGSDHHTLLSTTKAGLPGRRTESVSDSVVAGDRARDASHGTPRSPSLTQGHTNLRLVTDHAYNEYGFRWSPD